MTSQKLPRTAEEYREWWKQQRPEIPYGYCWCGCGQRTNITRATAATQLGFEGEPRRFVAPSHGAIVTRQKDIEAFKRRWCEEAPATPYGYCQCGCGEKTRISRYTNSAYGLVRGEPKRFLQYHATKYRPSDAEYLIEDCGFSTPCWMWQRGISDNGYARTRNREYAHRVYYEQHHGKIPDGLQLDHLCAPYGGPRSCVNPAHLEVVTHAENGRRGAQAKLTKEDVKAIRSLGKSLLQKEIGALYGIDPAHVSRILSEQVWANV